MANKRAVAAGHICIDITSLFPKGSAREMGRILALGRLVRMDGVDIHSGGAVANISLTMKRLGVDVRLMGKIGKDELGAPILKRLEEHGVAEGMILSDQKKTSYFVVLAILGIDHILLHDPGANVTFSGNDLDPEAVKGADLFHLGYPTLTRRIYQNQGGELARMFRRIKEGGTAIFLDMAAIDPSLKAAGEDWKGILKKVLPYMDFFVPNAEELYFMLDRERYQEWIERAEGRDTTGAIRVKNVKPLGQTVLNMGTGFVLIKCGAPGIYYRTASGRRIEGLCRKLNPSRESWKDKEGFEPSFEPDAVVFGTGAGDTSIAASLTSVLREVGLGEAVEMAAMAGACCVAAYDVLSGLKSLEEMKERIRQEWRKREYRPWQGGVYENDRSNHERRREVAKTLIYGTVGGGPGAFVDGAHRRATGSDGTAVTAAGVFSRNRERSLQTVEELGIPMDRCYEDYRAMARAEGEQEDGINFVVVVMPNQPHYEICRASSEAGIRVACDKPVTTIYGQAKELGALTEERGPLFMVTYIYMGHVTAKYTRELVTSGTTGEVRTVVAEYPQGWPAFEDDFGGKQGEWRCDLQQSGGVNCLEDLGTHVEDTVAAMTRLKIKRLLAKMDAIVPGRMLDDDDSILVEYDNGATGIYWTSQVVVGHDNSLRIRIYGSRGITQWLQETSERITVIGTDGTIREIHRGHSAIGEKADKYGRLPTGHPEGWIGAMGNLYRGFAECIRAKQEGAFDPGMADYSTVSQDVGGLAFVEACLESNKNRNTWVGLKRR